MTRERYNPNSDSWEDASGGRRTVFDKADDIYAQVGVNFEIRWVEGEPHVDFGDLPGGVSESDVRQAIRDNVN